MQSPFSNGPAFEDSRSREDKDSNDGDPESNIIASIRPDTRQLTLRAIVVGLSVGSLLCCSNTYFGLQSGWISMGSLQSAILGFGIFRLLEKSCGIKGFSMEENVIVQTTAVATATMPLAAGIAPLLFSLGLVGVVPAYGLLEPPVVFNSGQLILWSLALAFIGVFCAVPLRHQTILKEKLKFPSGTATANVIRTLHEQPEPQSVDTGDARVSRLRHRRPTLRRLPEEGSRTPDLESGEEEIEGLLENARSEALSHPVSSGLVIRSSLDLQSARSLLKADSINRHCSLDSKLRSMRLPDEAPEATEFDKAWKMLLLTFGIATAYTLAASEWPVLKSFPVFSWIGLPGVTAWGWELSPSLGYVGQGMIMGPRSAVSMLLGAIAGYGILGPLARSKGWAPGEIGDWHDGATGWILWISLAIMLADSLTSLALLCVSTARNALAFKRGGAPEGEVDSYHSRLPTWVWIVGLLVSAVFCTAVLTPMLHMKVYEPIAAVALALLVAVLAVRALGQTDLNPVSGVGKLSQVVFALIAPNQVVANLAAGAIAEAGAQQAGDMMQDFKTAHLLGVCPRSQFIAMLIGSGASVFVSVGAYLLFSSFYEIPSSQFPVPTAEIWLDMAKLVNGGSLPQRVTPFCIGGAVFGAFLPLFAALLDWEVDRLNKLPASSGFRLKATAAVRRCLPSGIGFAIGIYVQAKWTIPRVIGSFVEQLWLHFSPLSHASFMIVVASGLVLGEGTASIVAAIIKAIVTTIRGH